MHKSSLLKSQNRLFKAPSSPPSSFSFSLAASRALFESSNEVSMISAFFPARRRAAACCLFRKLRYSAVILYKIIKFQIRL
ncbi:hypothetical protein OPQ81_000194 [Rhizoctonia solani]|nr:hypothetical protein OPQ81_000194 [Rhizoctonia solani]